MFTWIFHKKHEKNIQNVALWLLINIISVSKSHELLIIET